MGITLRPYHHPEDYWKIDEFLIHHYQPRNPDGNWIEPAWEYMHFHPCLNNSVLDSIGIWEDGGEMVAVVHPEWRFGEAFFQLHPNYHSLKAEMLSYAETNLAAVNSQTGKKNLRIYINDNDPEFIAQVESHCYTQEPEETRPMYAFDIPDPFPVIPLVEEFRLTSLAEECNWAKVHRILWRGFNHQGEPPEGEGELESRQRMFDTPKARRDLKIAVSAPNGDFVAFCGMFYEPHNHFAYVEPVATDPDYRRLGLGKAAVLEGIRRCAQLGATVAYVGSDQPFYRAIGFHKIYNSECWVKNFE